MAERGGGRTADAPSSKKGTFLGEICCSAPRLVGLAGLRRSGRALAERREEKRAASAASDFHKKKRGGKLVSKREKKKQDYEKRNSTGRSRQGDGKEASLQQRKKRRSLCEARQNKKKDSQTESPLHREWTLCALRVGSAVNSSAGKRNLKSLFPKKKKDVSQRAVRHAIRAGQRGIKRSAMCV